MNKLTSLGMALIAAVALAGCASAPSKTYQSYLLRVPDQEDTGSHYIVQAVPAAFSATRAVSVREIVLSPKQPVDAAAKIELVSIKGDLTTTIRTRFGEVISGRPGDFFSCQGFGTTGLQLLMVSPHQGEVLFEQRLVQSR
jgi:hypothetical protein